MHPRVIPLLLACLSAPASSQIGLPPVDRTVGDVTDRLGRTIDDAAAGLDLRQPIRSASRLARDRVGRLTAFVRAHQDRVEMDDEGFPARRGIVLLLDPDAAALATAAQLGFVAGGRDQFGGLGLSTTELAVPAGMSLRDALARLRVAMPGKTVAADQLHFPGGEIAPAAARGSTRSRQPIATPVGVIDGGVGVKAGSSVTRGFARGAPTPSDHGSAVASLLRRAGVSRVYAADVYGTDPAGGGALAIVRALDWLAKEKIPVVSISLVGPRNPLLERAISAASARGMAIVAAVGNDGPSAPPAFPASYPAVIAVTGVDGRNRALIEAGSALHLDYAAPGADMKALDKDGRARTVRGTSFATPLVAARIAAARDRDVAGQSLRPTLDREARDLGRKGPDQIYGRGLLCGNCRE